MSLVLGQSARNAIQQKNKKAAKDGISSEFKNFKTLGPTIQPF
jgi:hypothetical protein